MAPEMLLQRGHGRVVDWWCLGLLMHEMLTGRHPFQGASHYDTLRAMVTAEPTIDPRVLYCCCYHYHYCNHIREQDAKANSEDANG